MLLNVNERLCVKWNGELNVFNPGLKNQRFDKPTAKSADEEGKKTHMMVLWWAIDPDYHCMVFLYMCQRMNERKKILQRLIWVYQPMILRSNHASVQLLMSLRDVWGALNSRTPPFGSPVGHTDCPPGGASLQATLEVIAGLLELTRSQTSRSDISRYQRMRHEHMVCNIFFSKRQDFRPPKLYNPRIHIGERYWPIGCSTCVYFITFHGGIDPWIAAFLPGPDSPKVVIRP